MTVQCAKCGQQLTTAQLAPGPRGVQCVYCGATVPVFEQNTLVTRHQAASVTPAVPDGLQIQGYQVLAHLGQGGMGDVYLGVQVSLNRKVAIKVLSAAFLQDPSFLARFDREIAALVRLTHPHIVTIFDRGHTTAGEVCYVMEYVEGEADGAPLDLERMIAEGRLDSQRTRELMLQVVQALGFAHREGIIHRDVKPSNVLIDRHGFAKVADFGIACMRGDHAARQVTTANVAVGTAIYASPEQQRDAASVDHRADIYGAGVMLYQMLTGNLPLAGYAPPSVAVPGLNRQWDAIVAKATQPRPEDRFGDMAEFESALRAIGPTVVAQPMPAPAPDGARPRSSAGSAVPMVCPQCGGAACEADQFCVSCGVSLWHDCRQCGQRVFAAARFCPGCRADLENQRVFEDYVQLGKEHLDEARQQPPSTDAVRHLEQARLALGKALSCLDDADARALAGEVNQLTVSVAWQAGEAAAAATRLTEASYCYGQMLEASPGHAKAAACLKKIASYRSELIAKAQTLFAEGRRKNALALLRTGVEQFEDDAELAELCAQYDENNAQLQELKDRIPVLERENRWCEVAQVVAELSQSGAATKGLDAESAKAQQRLAAVDPLVAAAKRSLDAGNTAQAVTQATKALEHVADHAEAMEIVELARSRDRVAQRRAACRRRRRRFLGSLAGLVCLALVSGVAYVGWREKQTVDQAEQQIKGGDYKAATQTLSGLPHRYIYESNANYLENLANLKQYASEREPPKPAMLETCKKAFIRLFGASETWRARARMDLADTIERVPPDADDALDRSRAIGQVLKELQVVEPPALAAALIAKAEERTRMGLALNASDSVFVLQILEWDPTAAGKVVELACGKGRPLERGLDAVQSWARAGAAFAPALSAAVVQVAHRLASQGEFKDAKSALAKASKIHACDTAEFWDTQFGEHVKRSGKTGGEVVLSWMVWEEQDEATLKHAVKLYGRLQDLFPGEEVKCPSEVLNRVRVEELNRRIAQADQAMKRGEYNQALKLFTAAAQEYPEPFKMHPQAKQLFADATFHDAIQRAREAKEKGELDVAQNAVEEALKVRPENPEAKRLQGEIQADWGKSLVEKVRKLIDQRDWDKAKELLDNALVKLPYDTQLMALSDEASAYQHGSAAKQAIDRGEFETAINEIVAVRVLLEKQPNASWADAIRQAIEALTAIARDKTCEQAQKLADQRQYEEALKKLAIAEKLSSTHPKVVDLRDRIKKLMEDPKTANLSGRWRVGPGVLVPPGLVKEAGAQRGLFGLMPGMPGGLGPGMAPGGVRQLASAEIEFEITQDGNQITVKAVQSPPPLRAIRGNWRQDGKRLVGTLEFDLGQQTITTEPLTANIKNWNTLAVPWEKLQYTDVKNRKTELQGYEDWTRVQGN